MKKILVQLFFFISPFTLFANPSPIDSLKQRMKNIELKTKSHDSLLIITNHLISENNKLISEKAFLEKKIDYEEKLLEKYDRLNNTIFTIIGILFAAFGLIGYFFVYKPAREDLKEAQTFLNDMKNNMDKLFSNFLVKSREESIEKALTKLEERDALSLQNSLYQLDTFKYDGFNISQIVRIIGLINSGHKGLYVLGSSLLYTDNKYVEDYFVQCIRSKTLLVNNAITYLAKYNKTQYFSDLKNYVLEAKSFRDMSSRILETSPQYLYELYNDDSFVDNINGITLHEVTVIKLFLGGGIYQGLDFHKTKLFQKYEKAQPIIQ